MFDEEKTSKAGEKVKIQILRKHQQLTGTLRLTEMSVSYEKKKRLKHLGEITKFLELISSYEFQPTSK